MSLKATQDLLAPQHEPVRSRFSSALLSTVFHVVQKVDSSFYLHLDEGSLRTHLFVPVVSGLKLPNFFETMREDGIIPLSLPSSPSSPSHFFCVEVLTLFLSK